MCTITIDKPELKIAEKDIIVYKHVFFKKVSWIGRVFVGIKYIASSIYAPIQFIYKSNILYSTNLDSFRESTWINTKIYVSGRGFYSYKNKKYGNAIFVIPKGAKYYLVRDKSDKDIWTYHSDQIKFIEPINV